MPDEACMRCAAGWDEAAIIQAIAWIVNRLVGSLNQMGVRVVLWAAVISI